MDQVSQLTIDLHIADVEGDIFNGAVYKVSVASVMGELGILPRHAPLLAQIKPGEVRIINLDREEEYIYVSGGFLEVQPHEVTILADTAIRSEEIDEAAALKAKEEAEEHMRDKSLLFSDRDEAAERLLMAIAQLNTLEHLRNKKLHR